MNNIVKAIGGLDVNNDEHWTATGLPSVEAVSEAVGGTVTRKQISEAAPGYDRDKARSGEELLGRAAAAEVKEGSKPPKAEEVEEDAADPIKLIEEALAAASTERYKRNYELLAFLRQYHVRQDIIKESQRRIDLRNKNRGAGRN